MSSRFDSDIKAALYCRYGKINDLNKSIEIWERILSDPDFINEDRELRLTVLNDSAETYLLRYGTNFGDLNNLNRLISLQERAVDMAKAAHSSQLPIYLNNLGDSLKLFYDKRHDISFLKRAVEAYQEAVDLSNKNSPNFHIYLNNLKAAQELFLNLHSPV